MARSLSLRSGTFTAARLNSVEMERLTGLTQVQLRDWRRRGLIKWFEAGIPSYDVFDVAEILLRRSMNLLGIPLADTASLARTTAHLVVADICCRSVDEDEVQDELTQVLANHGSVIRVQQGLYGGIEADLLDEDLLAHSFSHSPGRLGPVWGVIHVPSVARDIYFRSEHRLVTFASNFPGGAS